MDLSENIRRRKSFRRSFRKSAGGLRSGPGEIRECRERIAQVKGAKICPGCGELIPKDANYCMNCGTSFQKVQQEGTETEPDEPQTDTQEE